METLLLTPTQQRLGALTLKQDDEQAVELFEWAGIAASRADALQQQVVKLTHRYHNAEDTINKMHEQLKELMRAKSQHESQLIANFVQLLNEKKLKIRNQQRLLASATPDPAKGNVKLWRRYTMPTAHKTCINRSLI